jgi:hypothetical protein
MSPSSLTEIKYTAVKTLSTIARLVSTLPPPHLRKAFPNSSSPTRHIIPDLCLSLETAATFDTSPPQPLSKT